MYTRKTVRLIFMLAGGLLVCLAYISNLGEFPLISEILKDFGVLALSIALLDIVWGGLGGDLSEQERDWHGLRSVYLNPEESERDVSWIKLVKEANNRIDLQGLSLAYLTTNSEFIAAVKERIISGVKVRIILMAPDNPLLDTTFELQAFIYPAQLKTSCQTSITILKNVQEELKEHHHKKGSLATYLNKANPMSLAIRRFDDKLYVLPYIWNRNTFNSPVYYVNGESNRLFQIYLESFENQFYSNPQS